MIVLLFRLAVRLVPCVPRRLALTLAWLAAAIAARWPSTAQTQHRRNVARALGLPMNHPRVRRAAQRANEVQALNYLDLFRAGALSREEVIASVRCEGAEHLEAAFAAGRGALLVSAHLGSLDRAGLYLPARGYRCGAIVEPLRPPELLAIVGGQRQRLGGILVPLDTHVATHTGALLRQNIAIGVIGDWDIAGNGVSVPFLGSLLRMPAGPALFAIRYRAPIVIVRCLRDGPDRFALTIEPPFMAEGGGSLEERILATSRRIAAVLERYIRESPDQWVMYHNIWNDPAPDRASTIAPSAGAASSAAGAGV